MKKKKKPTQKTQVMQEQSLTTFHKKTDIQFSNNGKQPS